MRYSGKSGCGWKGRPQMVDVVEEQSIATNDVKEVTAWAEALGLQRWRIATGWPPCDQTDAHSHAVVRGLVGWCLPFHGAGALSQGQEPCDRPTKVVLNVDAPTLDLVVEGKP
jgi:hypothetical protein